jgi:hypothetical protein
LDSPPLQCSNSQDAVKQFLAQKSIPEIEHSPYSPDLAPNKFWMFPKIKSALEGQRFRIMKTSKNVTMALKAIPQHEFKKCLQQLQHCWAECTAAEGKYFKGDPSQ